MIRGPANITEDDEDFIAKIVLENGVETVLEFGSGISTLFLSGLVDIVSYETDSKYIKAVLGKNPRLDVRWWDGKRVTEELPKFDMAFVDGPAYGENRRYSTKIASQKTDIVIIHDAERKFEQQWQDKYLEEDFRLMASNRMCHCWIRND
jgi:hypothetical protein